MSWADSVAVEHGLVLVFTRLLFVLWLDFWKEHCKQVSLLLLACLLVHYAIVSVLVVFSMNACKYEGTVRVLTTTLSIWVTCASRVTCFSQSMACDCEWLVHFHRSTFSHFRLMLPWPPSPPFCCRAHTRALFSLGSWVLRACVYLLVWTKMSEGSGDVALLCLFWLPLVVLSHSWALVTWDRGPPPWYTMYHPDGHRRLESGIYPRLGYVVISLVVKSMVIRGPLVYRILATLCCWFFWF